MSLYKLGSDRIFFGDGAISELSTLSGERKRAFIVMSGSILTDLGLTDKIIQVLEMSGFEVMTYDDVEPDPSFTTVYKGAQSMSSFEPDWVIGFGGGSAMDAAKVMWAIYENPELDTVEKLIADDSITHLREKARLCCIPTTAGTGSEVTRAAVIKDLVSEVKYPVKDMKLRLMADIAILDPEMTMTMPKGLLAASGMDALTHAIESYVAVNSNQFSEMLSIQAFKLVSGSLSKSYEFLDAVEPRSDLLSGSAIAGMAFSNSGLGICHSIAHAFGGKLGIPHGLANAIALPYVIRYLTKESDSIRDKFQYLANQIGQEDLYTYVSDLNTALGIPATLEQALREPIVFGKYIDFLTHSALNDVCTRTSQIKPSEKVFESLIREVFYGH